MTIGLAISLSLSPAFFGHNSADATLNNSLCHLGNAAGQCEKPEGVAVDFETNRVYVVDQANNRVNVFKTDGEFLFAFGWGVDTGEAKLETCTTVSTCQAGISGSGAGQFNSPNLIAVDNSASPSKHDVYVGEQANRRLQKFDPEGKFLLTFGRDVNMGTSGKPNLCTNAGPPTDVCGSGSAGSGLGEFSEVRGVGVTSTGVVYVFDTRDLGLCEGVPANGREYERRLEKFNGAGEPSEAPKVTEGLPCGQVSAFAADPGGNFYIFVERDPRAIRKYNASATLLKEIDPGLTPRSLAVDGGGNLYAAQSEFRIQVIDSFFILTKYDGSSGDTLRRFAYGEIEAPVLGLAVSSTGHIFASERFSAPDPKVLDLTEPPGGPIVPPPSLKALPGATLATLEAELNPEGKASEYHFEYLTQQDYEGQGNSFSGSKTKKSPVKSVGSAGDFALKGIEEQIGCADPVSEGPEGRCLEPQTLYRFRIVASNPDGQGNTSLEGSFATEAAPKFLALWSSEVGPHSARLDAELNPFGLATTGIFEYVDDAKYQESGFAEASKAPPGGSLDFGESEAPVHRGATVFPLEPGATYHYRLAATNLLHTGLSPEATFRTFAHPAIEPCENDPFRYDFGAFLPDCRGYEMVSPLDKEGGDIMPGENLLDGAQAALDVSSLSGEKLAFGTLRAFAEPEAAPYISQYIAAREPVKEGWRTHSLAAPKTAPILSQTAQAILDTEFKAFSPDLCEAWLLRTSEPQLDPNGVVGYSNLYRQTDEECGEKSYEAITQGKPLDLPPGSGGSLELQGLAGDGTVAIYLWRDNLEGASPSPAPQPAKCTSEGKECQARLYEQKEGGPLEFVCVLPNGEPTSAACEAGTPNNGGGLYREVSVKNAISADGERVFWTPSGTGTGPIYVRIGGTETVAVSKAAEEEANSSGSQFWSAAEDGTKVVFTTGTDGRLYEFAVDTKTTTLVAKGVSGVAGVSEDANKTYFTSTEAIAGSGENTKGDKAIAGKPNLYLREAGVGGGVRFIATVASADVTPAVGTFNPTMVAPQPVYRANRVSADGMSLVFMSAGSPTGYDNTDLNSSEADTEVYLYDAGSDELLCASCNPSGARPAGEFDESVTRELWVGAKIPTWSNILYAPRVLSKGGQRLFFESPDALVTRDSNGLSDIYVWEAPGAGSCTNATYTYSELNQGCVDLISSGKGSRKAEFVDASPTGRDVFFTYQQSLVGQDTDKLVDIYDARVNGGFPKPPPPLEDCEGETCQPPAEAPQFQIPSSTSAHSEGSRNAMEEKPKPRHCRKGTHKVKTKAGKTRCVKNKHK